VTFSRKFETENIFVANPNRRCTQYRISTYRNQRLSQREKFPLIEGGKISLIGIGKFHRPGGKWRGEGVMKRTG
jgi:hypothetical protein